MQNFRVEKQRPAFGLNLLASVSLATNLSGRNAHQSMAVKVVFGESIGEFFQSFIADKHAIDIVIIERMAAMFQLV